jgi:hypothetical protein
MLTGMTLKINCESASSVRDIKGEIKERTGIPKDQQKKLLFEGQQLLDGKHIRPAHRH